MSILQIVFDIGVWTTTTPSVLIGDRIAWKSISGERVAVDYVNLVVSLDGLISYLQLYGHSF